MIEPNNLSETPADESFDRHVLLKVSLRLLPFLCLLYIVNILDRGNVGFAKLQMFPALGMGDRVFSFGAGIFFIGYATLGVPSNLVLRRIRARPWIATIMIAWGLISAGTMLVRGPWSFILLRFLLGCAEAGFFPGIVLYLTFWFPPRERAKAVALFMLASPLAEIAGLPLSGALLQYANGWAGLAGWQWLFLVEAVPAVVLGVVVLFYLTDRPEQANWLTPEERSALAAQLVRAEPREKKDSATLWEVVADGRIWLLAALYSALAAGISVLAYYLPTLIKPYFPGHGELDLGLIVAIPSACTLIPMVIVATLSDWTGECRWHLAGAAFLAAFGWALAATFSEPLPFLLGLTLTKVAMMSALAPFWSLTTSMLSHRAAPAGIALINALGNLGAFFGPNILGQLQSDPPDFAPRLLVTALLLVLSGILTLSVRRENKENG